MKGEGAIVFITVFIVFLAVTLGYPEFPPGKILYELLDILETEYLVLGVPANLLVNAIINGVIYGVILWLVFTFGYKRMKS